MRKKCLDCGDPISGRTDKKFCTDMCRNAYHNKYNGYRNAMIRYVNHKLRKNRHILAELSKAKTTELTREELSFNGYDWQYFTEERLQNSLVNRFCYDYGIEIGDDELVRVIPRALKGTRKSHDPVNLVAAEAMGKYEPAKAAD
ncbi:MAG: hypothetical protein JNL88_10690 [Bacteroidia bacterium]|nr:hypothetical protein [Bacteroidia bacterium]